ncbi:MAG: enoyl-CoA hydratase [Gammaproteobacteria bacterium]|nr:enoyl-CoA hydratase [Gammaproteobacteria bacterium]|tara:strand:- start:631 stop:1419 length:789 start_codon:yes stop_codon:yes gene_type:complete
MTFETLIYDVADGVATITLNRPDAANAMSPTMAAELAEVALVCDDDPLVRAVVITGTGKLFCAGGDLGAFASAGDGVKSLIKKMATDLHVGLSRLTRTSAPVIAAVNGTAAGAGFSLCMATDLAVAAQSAVFTMAYTRAGLSPDGSSTFFMPRRIGDRRTRELMLTNRVLSAEEALDWGLVNQVVEDDRVLEQAQLLAKQLASGPTLAYGAVKTLLNGTFEQSLEAQMELESRAIADMAATHDGREGISAFLEKRNPEFTGD